MPLLDPADELPASVNKLLVAGTSGAGKTSLAARIAVVLDVPHVEIDGLYHGPGWVPRPSFAEDVAALIRRPGWVTEWQYGSVRSQLAAAADAIVWLDLPRSTIMRHVVLRTVRRRLGREELWHGNIEPPLHTFFTDDEHVVRWAWRTHAQTAVRIAAVLAERPELPVVRLRAHSAAACWLAGPLTAVSERRRPA